MDGEFLFVIFYFEDIQRKPLRSRWLVERTAEYWADQCVYYFMRNTNYKTKLHNDSIYSWWCAMLDMGC